MTEAAEGQSWTVAGVTSEESVEDILDPTTDLKIYRYIVTDHGSRKNSPIDLDYIVGLNRRLFRKEYFNRGELYKIEFYAETATGADGWPTYSDLIIREDIAYTRDSLGFAKERDTVITWFKEDGTAHDTSKTLYKPYSLMESQKEGVTRRSNIISQLSLQVAGMLVATLPTNEIYQNDQAKIEVGREFMQTHKMAMDMFVSASKRDLVAEVKYATNSWLNNVVAAPSTTIRDVIRAGVDIWGIWDSV